MEEGIQKYRELFAELEDYERKGVCITINEHPASPLQVVSAFMVKEERSNYMRDYDLTEQGKVRRLNFCHI